MTRLPADYWTICDMIHWHVAPLEIYRMEKWRKPFVDLAFPEVMMKVAHHSWQLARSFVDLVSDPDLAMIQFSFVDRLAHLYGTSEAIIEPVYRLGLELTAYLRAAIDASNTIIVSDHGFKGRTHTPHGVLAFQGPDWPEVADTQPSTESIAPTVLSLFELDTQNYAFDGAPIQMNPGSNRAYDESERQQILERLKDLGYL